ncbi:MAG: hypothetical protein IT328_11740 [Caldilineaceae bacterium]|nr:hypothetical protein [Caldilineaceae bacterium]
MMADEIRVEFEVVYDPLLSTDIVESNDLEEQFPGIQEFIAQLPSHSLAASSCIPELVNVVYAGESSGMPTFTAACVVADTSHIGQILLRDLPVDGSDLVIDQIGHDSISTLTDRFFSIPSDGHGIVGLYWLVLNKLSYKGQAYNVSYPTAQSIPFDPDSFFQLEHTEKFSEIVLYARGGGGSGVKSVGFSRGVGGSRVRGGGGSGVKGIKKGFR